jgi:hypothetical protein
MHTATGETDDVKTRLAMECGEGSRWKHGIKEAGKL